MPLILSKTFAIYGSAWHNTFSDAIKMHNAFMRLAFKYIGFNPLTLCLYWTPPAKIFQTKICLKCMLSFSPYQIHLEVALESCFLSVDAKRERMDTIQISDMTAPDFPVDLIPNRANASAHKGMRRRGNWIARVRLMTTNQPSLAFEVIALVQSVWGPTSVWRLAPPLMILSQPRKSTWLVNVLNGQMYTYWRLLFLTHR